MFIPVTLVILLSFLKYVMFKGHWKTRLQSKPKIMPASITQTQVAYHHIHYDDVHTMMMLILGNKKIMTTMITIYILHIYVGIYIVLPYPFVYVTS